MVRRACSVHLIADYHLGMSPSSPDGSSRVMSYDSSYANIMGLCLAKPIGIINCEPHNATTCVIMIWDSLMAPELSDDWGVMRAPHGYSQVHGERLFSDSYNFFYIFLLTFRSSKALGEGNTVGKMSWGT